MAERSGTAIVTGAAGGLGRVVAARLVRAGLDVTLVGRRPDPLAALAASLGAGAYAHPADVRDPEAIRRVVDGVVARHGRVDVAVHAAALLADPQAHDVDPWTHFDCVLRTNVLGAAVLTEACALAMTAGGLVALIGSSSAAVPTPDALAYGASKAALAQLTASLAARHRHRRVRVVCVAPGALHRDDPAAGPTACDDVAEAIVFLASRWGRRVNGCVWPVDGGEAAGVGASRGPRR